MAGRPPRGGSRLLGGGTENRDACQRFMASKPGTGPIRANGARHFWEDLFCLPKVSEALLAWR